MKSKQQKIEEIKDGISLTEKSESIVLISFSKTTVNSINELKKTLRSINSFFKVMKKTLLSIIFKRKNIDLDPNSFFGQVGVVFGEKDIVDTAGEIYRFKKSHKEDLAELKMVAGYDIKNGVFYDGERILELGMLPPHDVLLAQFIGMLSAPMRAFAVVLGQIADKKQDVSETAVEDTPKEKESDDKSPEDGEAKDTETKNNNEKVEDSKEIDKKPEEETKNEENDETKE